MKKLMMIPLAVAMTFALGNESQAGLFDGVFDVFEQTSKQPPGLYGKIVWQQSAPRRPISRTAFLQPATELPPMPEGNGEAMPAKPPVKLYHHVKYEDLHNIHPCAVKMIVQVMDPCPPPRDPCSCCKPAPRYVYVQICVPPCGCKKIETSRHGSKVEYDYGKYEIEITSKRGVVYVDYDD